jgi:hypothetical protein
MSAAITAAAIAVGGSAIIANDQAQRAKGEANKLRSAQSDATKAGIAFGEKQLEEQQFQFDKQMAEYQRKQQLLEQQFAQTQQQLAPYVQSGTGALYEMNALLGMAAPKPVTYSMKRGITGQYEVAQQPTVQRPSPAGSLIDANYAAPTTPASGNLGILSQSVAPIRRKSEELTPINQRSSDVMAELNKGGLSLASSQWDKVNSIGEHSTRATAAKLYQQIKANMPNATEDEVHREFKKRAATLPEYSDAAQAAQGGLQPAQQTDQQMAQPEQPVSPYAGLTGQEAQAQAIEKIAQSPLLAELTRQGEEALLQNRAATGGLRGGNTQGALAQFRPAMLQAEIDKYYGRLAGLSGVGQQSILSSPTMGQAGGYPTQYPTSNSLGGLYSNLALAQGIQPSTESQGGVNKELISGLGQLAGAGLGYLENRPQTQAPQTNLTASGQLMPNTTTSGNFWSRPPG